MRIGREIAGLYRSIKYDLEHSKRARRLSIVGLFSFLLAGVMAVGVVNAWGLDTSEDAAVNTSGESTAGVADQDADTTLGNGGGNRPSPSLSPTPSPSPSSPTPKPSSASPTPTKTESSHTPTESPTSPKPSDPSPSPSGSTDPQPTGSEVSITPTTR
ncbi:hypothetical protein [Stackebrandtia soli]|uniref:hypothetical protein n=1 Tax=Stackebrandtia soli TaxID=1892856 RepID=UPI0039EA3F07